MTNEEVGQYIRLLCAMHQHGRLNIRQCHSICHGITSAVVMEKFSQDENGLFYNCRLEEVMGKRKNFIDNQTNKAKKRWNKEKSGNATAYATAMPIENGNENENRNEYINKSSEIENPILWTSAKNSFLNSDEWKYQFCTSKKVSKAKLEKYMDEFIADCELKTDYKDLKELKKHFTNWFNLKNKSNGKGLSEVSQQRQDAYAEYVNRHRE